jgi:hypothetical protein
MHIKICGVNHAEDRFRTSDLLWRTVRQDEKAFGFHGGLVLDHTVLRHANAVELRKNRTQRPTTTTSSTAGGLSG